jgi:tetratricopeptide (TPR) repeat protein
MMGLRLHRLEYTGNGKWSNISLLRLFRNHPEIRYSDINIHASVASSILSSGGEIGSLDINIHHFDILVKNRASAKRSFYPEKIQDSLENDTMDLPIKVYLTNFLGLEYDAAKRSEEAVEKYYEAARLNANYQVPPFEQMYLAQHYLSLGDIDKAKEIAEVSLNRLDGSQFSLKRIGALPFVKEKLLIVLADVSYRQDNKELALNCVDQALATNPFSAHNYINLASLYEDSDPTKAYEFLTRALELNPMLENPAIYQYADEYNTFAQQISFISSTRPFHSHMKKCLTILGKEKEAYKWQVFAEKIGQSSL